MIDHLSEGINRQNKIQSARLFLVFISAIVTILIWEIAVALGDFPAFILPKPSLVWSRFIQVLQDGSLLDHMLVTLGEVLAGLALGAITSTTLGYILAKSRTVEQILAPYIVASQSVPVVAIAPLLEIGRAHV